MCVDRTKTSTSKIFNQRSCSALLLTMGMKCLVSMPRDLPQAGGLEISSRFGTSSKFRPNLPLYEGHLCIFQWSHGTRSQQDSRNSEGTLSIQHMMPKSSSAAHTFFIILNHQGDTQKRPFSAMLVEPLASGVHFTICACHPDNWATGHANLLSIVSSANWRPDYLQAYTWVHWLNSDTPPW